MDYQTDRENHRGNSAILFTISMNQMYLAGLFLLVCGTMFCIKNKKCRRLADPLGIVTTSYLFVGLALSGAKIYLAGLFLLASGTIYCMKSIKCRLVEAWAILTEYYIFIGLVVNAIQYILKIHMI